MAKKLETLLEFERESQSIVAASWKLGIFKDIPGRFTGVYEAYPIWWHYNNGGNVWE